MSLFTGSPQAVSHVCPHFSDSLTKWPPSEHLLHHTDFKGTNQMFCNAISGTGTICPCTYVPVRFIPVCYILAFFIPVHFIPVRWDHIQG
jgi:hypothetical protein